MTRTLLVAYDLADDSTARPAIAEALMRMGEAWARPLDTVWMLRTTLAPEAVEARLAALLGSDDGLMVQETRGEAQLVNTGLRWFRPRRELARAALATAAVLAFPSQDDGGAPELDRAA